MLLCSMLNIQTFKIEHWGCINRIRVFKIEHTMYHFEHTMYHFERVRTRSASAIFTVYMVSMLGTCHKDNSCEIKMPLSIFQKISPC